MNVETGTPLAEALGFKDKLFNGWLEVREHSGGGKQIIYVGYINSRHEGLGNARTLFRRWINLGFDVRIVKPCDRMKKIIERMGFEEGWEDCIKYYKNDGQIEVWRRYNDRS